MDYWNDARGLQEDWKRAEAEAERALEWATALEESGAGSADDVAAAWDTVVWIEQIASTLYASAARAAARGAR